MIGDVQGVEKCAEQYPAEELLAVSSSHFPDLPALPINPQLLTAGSVIATSSASSSHCQHDFFAQSNLPQLQLFHWNGLAAAAVISQLLTQTLQCSNHSKAAATQPSWTAATLGRSQTDGCLQRAEKLTAVHLHTV